MQSDPTSEAWGLFQVRFAFLVQQLAAAVFYFRRRREPKLQFQQIFKKSLEQLLDALKQELSVIPNGGHSITVEVEELQALAAEIETLKNWRDPRVHARVSFDGGIALYHWRTRKQLAMTASECNQKSEHAIQLALKLDYSVGSLLRLLRADESLVSELEILMDAPD